MATDQNDELLERAVALLEEIVRRLPEQGADTSSSPEQPRAARRAAGKGKTEVRGT